MKEGMPHSTNGNEDEPKLSERQLKLIKKGHTIERASQPFLNCQRERGHTNATREECFKPGEWFIDAFSYCPEHMEEVLGILEEQDEYQEKRKREIARIVGERSKLTDEESAVEQLILEEYRKARKEPMLGDYYFEEIQRVRAGDPRMLLPDVLKKLYQEIEEELQQASNESKGAEDMAEKERAERDLLIEWWGYRLYLDKVLITRKIFPARTLGEVIGLLYREAELEQSEKEE